MKELGYNPNTRKFRFRQTNNVIINGVTKTFLSFFIHDYYPKNHFGSDVDADIVTIRRLVYNYKDGKISKYIAELIIDAILTEKLVLTNTCLVVIPASTQEKTVVRFQRFCEIVSTRLRIANAFEAITTKPHEATKGVAGGDKIKYFNFNSALYRNKNVFLFDDVRTSGTTFRQVLLKLIDSGASDVTGIFLAMTVLYD